MGIEKYFGAIPSKPKAASPAKKATTTTASRKRKTAVQDDDDDNDFQQKPKAVEQKVDPKLFFGKSNKTSASKAAESKPESKAIKSEPGKAEPKPVKAVPKPVKAKSKATETKKALVLSDSEDEKPKPRKARAKAIVLSDSEDDFVADDDEEIHDNNDEDEEEEMKPPVKKAKLEEPVKKAPAKKAPVKKTPAKKAEKVEEKVEEKEEKPKKKSNYFAKMTHEEPKALGTRPPPEGAPNCLQGLTMVITGQYETLTRDQTKDLILRYGGRVTGGLSGKTDYLVAGREAGESKLAKAKTLKTKILDEDAFYSLIESKPAQKEEYAKPPPASAAKGKAKVNSVSDVKLSQEDHATQLWTEKYKPRTVEDIIGNKELVKRISEWLANWQTNFNKGFENEGDDINSWRALLLSGPPGIGKTTTANVVANINGYEPLEFNASDVRSKKVLEASITEMMDNRTMTEFFQPASKGAKIEPKLLQGKKVVLIMDEVDGMSGGDRGGAVELAGLIRKSKIPVICICNDSRSTKVAPLLRVCYEAKYKRTPALQIRSRILSIAFKEKLRITPNAVDELVAATHNDIRQIINILSTYRLNETGMDYDQAKAVGKNNEKYSILGLFDIPLELLSQGSWSSKTLNEKADVYFHDYSLAHLMIFENYLKVEPTRGRAPDGDPRVAQCNTMDMIAEAAEAMADGDLVDSMIHGTVQHYSLMPVHSIFSCVRPASFMRGSIKTRLNFPSWLGQNSKSLKYARLLGDLQTRMRLKASGDKFEIRQNYIPTLNDRIFGELQQENLDEAMDIMDTYYLDRDNIDTLSELTFLEPKQKSPFSMIPTKAKTAFTRQYNAKSHPILFQLSGAPIKKVAASGPSEDAEGTLVEEDEPTFGGDVSENDMEDDPEKKIEVKYIKETTKRKTPASSGSGIAKKQKTKK